MDVLVVLLVAAPVILVLLLAAFISADPPPGVTASRGPLTDESWDVVNARNFVLLGRWSTDDWNLYLLNFPFSLSEAAMFSVAGVGIVQARVISIGHSIELAPSGVAFIAFQISGSAHIRPGT